MESGTIASWNLKEGDSFGPGDVFCAVETDKATMDFEAQDEGVLAKILVQPEDGEVQCGEPIMVITEEGEDISAFKDFKADSSASAPSPSEEKSEESASPPPPSAPSPAPSPASEKSAPPPSSSGDRIFASPLAYTLAKEMGYDIRNIPGTGPRGRIIAADVKEYQPGQAEAAAAPAGEAAAPSTVSEPMLAGPPVHGEGYTDFPISDAAQEIAARLVQSKRNVPHYYLTIDITMDDLLKTRKTLSAAVGGDEKPALGVYEFLLKAAAKAMRDVPTANASWMDSVVRVYDNVDINIVVGSGDTLYTPVIKDCGNKGIKGISDELAANTAYLEDDEEEASSPPSPSDVGTFTVLNVGIYGVKTCAPIIREPQVCSLAIGALENRIVPNDDEADDEIYKESVVMTATLSCDHRVVDGAVGAQWLAAFKTYVENPSTLLL